MLLQELGLDVARAATAAAGSDGDRYVAARCAERRELVWLTAWDSEPDAEEFAADYAAVAPTLAARAGLGAPPEITRRGRRVGIASGGLATLAAELPARARIARVTSIDGVRAHFGEPHR